MTSITPIRPGLYATPDPALTEELARRPVTAYPDMEPLDEGWKADITPAELATEYAALVAYTTEVAAEDGLVAYGSTYIIDPDGQVRFVRDLEDIEPQEWPRALLTAALQARALRKALGLAEQQFAAMLWTAQGHREDADLDPGSSA